jgi:hypothetical protein
MALHSTIQMTADAVFFSLASLYNPNINNRYKTLLPKINGA